MLDYRKIISTTILTCVMFAITIYSWRLLIDRPGLQKDRLGWECTNGRPVGFYNVTFTVLSQYPGVGFVFRPTNRSRLSDDEMIQLAIKALEDCRYENGKAFREGRITTFNHVFREPPELSHSEFVDFSPTWLCFIVTRDRHLDMNDIVEDTADDSSGNAPRLGIVVKAADAFNEELSPESVIKNGFVHWDPTEPEHRNGQRKLNFLVMNEFFRKYPHE
ncbi:hypothetical protein Spb1_01060 [Planctopirus ephydatiae]|uniref:Uncharacterized protein n=1 Tax=Planctopirus ephydatiae TaxID=2528019 RepID=A0A518GI28_9PLAN|nr:hypothetical protein [Planctopirus ephydatiae]QDV28243.1 hypothetical protein Spb1_01060 [Planctopirus ephydatiae]